MLGRGRPITVVAAERTVDEYGSDVPDWEHVTITVTRGYVQPLYRGDGETMVERDEQRADARLWLLPGIPITGRDRVLVDGDAYEVIGEPGSWRPPMNARARFTQAEIRRVYGPP
jgi:hypothetical protein